MNLVLRVNIKERIYKHIKIFQNLLVFPILQKVFEFFVGIYLHCIITMYMVCLTNVLIHND